MIALLKLVWHNPADGSFLRNNTFPRWQHSHLVPQYSTEGSTLQLVAMGSAITDCSAGRQ